MRQSPQLQRTKEHPTFDGATTCCALRVCGFRSHLKIRINLISLPLYVSALRHFGHACNKAINYTENFEQKAKAKMKRSKKFQIDIERAYQNKIE